MSKSYRYNAILAKQSAGHTVLTFAAKPQHILEFAEIDRAGRTESGELKGFQRHQVSPHIKEIRDYLAREDAVLPNAVVLAFIDGVTVTPIQDNIVEVVITIDEEKPGYVVDGQQRLTALSGLLEKDFEVFVSTLICKDYNELRQQFVLINSTRPLPKTLIYELLPTVTGLPEKFTVRQFAAKVSEQLNYSPDSFLKGMIRLHTNPSGFISDTAVQKIVMNSTSDGAMRLMTHYADPLTPAVEMVSNFFEAVKETFPRDWEGHKPRTSRLVHGAGVAALGYVMEHIYSRYNSYDKETFKKGLKTLVGYTAWANGTWHFSEADQRQWNKIQNVPNDISVLAHYLLRVIKNAEAYDVQQIKVAVAS